METAYYTAKFLPVRHSIKWSHTDLYGEFCEQNIKSHLLENNAIQPNAINSLQIPKISTSDI